MSTVKYNGGAVTYNGGTLRFNGADMSTIKFDGFNTGTTVTISSGAQSETAVSWNTQPDVTPPQFSATGATSGDAQGTLQWNVSEACDFWYVVQEGANRTTKPTTTQMEAGQDYTGAAAVDSGYVEVTTPGAQTDIEFTLTNGNAYAVHFFARDAAGLESGREYRQMFPTAPAAPDPDTVWDETASPGTSVTINIDRADHQVAPEAMQFEVTLSGFDTNTGGVGAQNYDASFHDKYVFWDFGEGYNFVAPTQVIAMDAVDGGNRADSRYMRGPLGGHVYRTPGTYTVKVAVYEPSSGKWGQGTTSVTVGNPDTYFSGTQTIYVSTAGNYTDAPSGAQTTTSLSSALSTAQSANSPTRIVLRNGETHTFTSPFGNFQPSGKSQPCLRIEARFKTGTRPKIRLQGSNFDAADYENRFIVDRQRKGSPSASKYGTVFDYLDLEGTWNTVTESGNTGQFYQNDGPQSGSTNVLFDRCRVRGFWTFYTQLRWNSVTGNNDSSNSGIKVTLNDNDISDWHHYGFFSDALAKHQFLGNKFAQNVDAQAGAAINVNAKPPNNNRSGPMRITTSISDVIAYNDYFSSTGPYPWASLHAGQAALRWGTSPGFSGMKLNMEGNTLESYWTALLLIPANSGFSRRPGNLVVSGNLLISGFQLRASVELAHGGTTIRDNIFVVADVPLNSSSFGGQSNFMRGWVWMSGGGANLSNNLAAPMRIYNNTLVNLNSSSVTGGVINDDIGFNTVTNANNLIHEPTRGNTPNAPLSSATLFTARYKGYKDDTPISLQTQVAHAANTARLLTPDTGSAAISAASGTYTSAVQFTPDFTGAAIIAAADRDLGAVQS